MRLSSLKVDRIMDSRFWMYNESLRVVRLRIDAASKVKIRWHLLVFSFGFFFFLVCVGKVGGEKLVYNK